MLVAVAACLLSPFVPTPATYSQRRWSEENLSRVLLALHEYAGQHDRFPDDLLAGGRPVLSWRVAVLPFLDGGRYAKLHAEFRLTEPWDGPHNRPLLARMPYTFRGGRDHLDGVRVARPTSLTGYKVVRGPARCSPPTGCPAG